MTFNLHHKPMNCQLIFHQRKDTEHVNTCICPSTEWLAKSSEFFFKQRKVDVCKLTTPKVYIRVPERDKRPPAEIQAEYLAAARDIHAHTRVDPRRIGSLQDTALWFFTERLKHARLVLPKATVQEGTWLHNCHRGGIQWAVPSQSTEFFKYDFTSYYASVCHSDLPFPTGAPTKHCVEETFDLDTVPAIYRVHVHGRHKLLKLTPMDCCTKGFVYVTNLDLISCLDLGVSVELADATDGWANCLKWEPGITTARGSAVFGRYVHTFFKMKLAGSKAGKLMLNVLTGLLVQKDKKHLHGLGSGAPIDVTRKKIQSLTPDRLTYFASGQHIFTRPHLARLGVFITAHARRKLIELLLDQNVIDDIVQVHTDGFISRKALPVSCTADSKALGGLKLERTGSATVHHVNKVAWD